VREVIRPEDFYREAEEVGLKRVYAEWFWDAHWVLPPPERTWDAYLRKVISETSYRKFLVWYDYKPEPRPGIEVSDVDIMLKTQYDLPGRIDARWMLRWGEITPDEHRELTRIRGIAPEWINKVAEAERKNMLIDERTRILSALRGLWRDGFRELDKIHEELLKRHYSKWEAEWILDSMKLEEELYAKRAERDAAIDSYRAGQIDEIGLEAELKAIPMRDEVVKRIVREGTLRKLGRVRKRGD